MDNKKVQLGGYGVKFREVLVNTGNAQHSAGI